MTFHANLSCPVWGIYSLFLPLSPFFFFFFWLPLFVLFGSVVEIGSTLQSAGLQRGPSTFNCATAEGRHPSCSTFPVGSVPGLRGCPFPTRELIPSGVWPVPHPGHADTTEVGVHTSFISWQCTLLPGEMSPSRLQFPVNYPMHVVSTIYNQFCPAGFLKKRR